MKNKIVAITGMTGVGKDFLLERANREYKLPTINLGTLISQIVQTNRDEMMDTLPPSQIEEAQFAAYKKVAKMQAVVVTCHAIRPFDNIYTYNFAMEKIFNPFSYVFVAAPPSVIVARVHERNLSGHRKSPSLAIDETRRVQAEKLRRMRELTAALGCPLLVLNNTDEALKENVRKLQLLLGKIV